MGVYDIIKGNYLFMELFSLPNSLPESYTKQSRRRIMFTEIMNDNVVSFRSVKE